LRTDQGYARVTDVAGFLGISRGAASLALSQLKERGLVKEDPNRFLLLTEEGARLAHTVEHNYALLTCFFENVLGVPSEIARADACKMEHLLSELSSNALVRFLKVLFSNKKWTKELMNEFNKDMETCEGQESCPLCKDVGQCLMPDIAESK
jgi:Mn-dependent DtxR family transcriptional regulator